MDLNQKVEIEQSPTKVQDFEYFHNKCPPVKYTLVSKRKDVKVRFKQGPCDPKIFRI